MLCHTGDIVSNSQPSTFNIHWQRGSAGVFICSVSHCGTQDVITHYSLLLFLACRHGVMQQCRLFIVLIRQLVWRGSWGFCYQGRWGAVAAGRVCLVPEYLSFHTSWNAAILVV